MRFKLTLLCLVFGIGSCRHGGNNKVSNGSLSTEITNKILVQLRGTKKLTFDFDKWSSGEYPTNQNSVILVSDTRKEVVANLLISKIDEALDGFHSHGSSAFSSDIIKCYHITKGSRFQYDFILSQDSDDTRVYIFHSQYEN